MTDMKELLHKVYQSEKLSKVLNIVMTVCTVITVIGFVLSLGWLVENGKYVFVVSILITSSVGFFLVSGVRMLINARRPYEVYPFYEFDPKKKRGLSFPSRHAFSAAVIAMLTALVHPWVMAVLSVVCVVMCACRVLLGVHFIRDVTVGAAIGYAMGFVGVYAGYYIQNSYY
jgi:membrane-associated phospholipid phosphatase